jgi:hypothetical protein
VSDGAQEAQVTRSEGVGPGDLEQHHADALARHRQRHGHHRVDAQPPREARPDGGIAFGVAGQVRLPGAKDLVDATALLERQARQAERPQASTNRRVRRADRHQAVQLGSIHEQVRVVHAEHLDQHLCRLVHGLGKAARADVQQALERAEIAIVGPPQPGLGRPGGQRRPRRQAELPQDAIDVVGHRAGAEGELHADLRVCLAAGHQRGDLQVAWGEERAASHHKDRPHDHTRRSGRAST